MRKGLTESERTTLRVRRHDVALFNQIATENNLAQYELLPKLLEAFKQQYPTLKIQ
jgi:hypothetical protein